MTVLIASGIGYMFELSVEGRHSNTVTGCDCKRIISQEALTPVTVHPNNTGGWKSNRTTGNCTTILGCATSLKAFIEDKCHKGYS